MTNTNQIRPYYESEVDVANERRIGERVALAWKGKLVKMKRAYSFDWGVVDWDRTVRAMVEVKCRVRYSMDDLKGMGGVMLSLEKYSAGLMMSEVSGLPYVFAVELADGVWWRKLTREHSGIIFTGRTDRGDVLDMEPVVLLSGFARL